jgi:hypothetical protein
LRASRRGTPAASENTASWEIWNRVDVPEFHEQVNAIVTDPNQPGAASPSVVAELKDIFLHNGIDSGRPLSTLAYRNWRIVNRAQDEWKPTRTDSGEIAFAITSTATGPYAANALREIEVTVRASDWHTVGQRMRVQSAGGVREYELNETSYEVVSLGSLPTTVFGPPTTTASPSSLHENVAAPVLPLPARESILAATTSPPDNVHSGLVAAAIETQYALHKLNVCIEEQLTVELTKDGQVVVRGTVPDLKRWQQIADGLSGLHAKPQLEISILAANSSPKVSPMGSFYGFCSLGSGADTRNRFVPTCG